MKIRALLVIGSLGLAFSEGAFAAKPLPPDHGIEAAVRLGLAIPAGSPKAWYENTTLDSYAGSAVPLVLEAGWRIDPSLFVGARFLYAFPQLKNPMGSCDNNNVSCDGYDMSLGVEGVYRFMADRKFAPWAGAGFGYEWLSKDINRLYPVLLATPPMNINMGYGATYRGFEGLLQAGGDVRLSSQLVLGPFAEVTLGRFDTMDSRVRVGNTTTETTTDIKNGAAAWRIDLHTWISFGIRGAFGF
jgi:hypothetical protein